MTMLFTSERWHRKFSFWGGRIAFVIVAWAKGQTSTMRSQKHTVRSSRYRSEQVQNRDLKVIHTEMIAEFMNEINKVSFREIWYSARGKCQTGEVLQGSKEKELQKKVRFSPRLNFQGGRRIVASRVGFCLKFSTVYIVQKSLKECKMPICFQQKSAGGKQTGPRF